MVQDSCPFGILIHDLSSNVHWCCYACDHRVNVAHLVLQEFRGKLVLDFLDQK